MQLTPTCHPVFSFATLPSLPEKNRSEPTASIGSHRGVLFSRRMVALQCCSFLPCRRRNSATRWHVSPVCGSPPRPGHRRAAPRPLSISYIDDFSSSLRPPWTVAHQAPPSVGFSRQDYWRGLPFPSPGDLPNPGMEPRSPALQADALRSEPPGFPILYIVVSICHSQAPSTSHLPLSPLRIRTLLLCVSISAFQIGSSIPFF